jgi:HSP20 family protein
MKVDPGTNPGEEEETPMAEKREDRSEQQTSKQGIQRSAQDRGLAVRRDPFDTLFQGPFALMRRMQEDMDRVFGNLGFGRGLGLSGRERGEWTPAIDAFQRGSDFVVRADVPGLKPEDISVEINDDAITLQGERKYEHEEEREGVYRSERSYGSFYRVIPLPEGAVADSAKATFKDGVLEITMQAPPQEVRRGRRIEIDQESGERAEEKR